jgi:dihydropteroate synthase
MDTAKITLKKPIRTLNCNGKLISLDIPKIMGIINVTPDSFYTGNNIKTSQSYIDQAGQMIEDGASFLDLGGQSTRPGSSRITAEEEAERVIPVIDAIHQVFPEHIISVDTYHHQVAKWAIEAGARMVNDVSAGAMDPMMLSTVASLDVPYIAMHMKGTPDNMQDLAIYDDIILEVVDYFIRTLSVCKKAGIKDVIIDPGFGFAKTPKQSLFLLRELKKLEVLDVPMLVGVSRKSMIYKTLNITPEEALNGTTILNTMALERGADILRVHDVKQAKEAITLVRGD